MYRSASAPNADVCPVLQSTCTVVFGPTTLADRKQSDLRGLEHPVTRAEENLFEWKAAGDLGTGIAGKDETFGFGATRVPRCNASFFASTKLRANKVRRTTEMAKHCRASFFAPCRHRNNEAGCLRRRWRATRNGRKEVLPGRWRRLS